MGKIMSSKLSQYLSTAGLALASNGCHWPGGICYHGPPIVLDLKAPLQLQSSMQLESGLINTSCHGHVPVLITRIWWKVSSACSGSTDTWYVRAPDISTRSSRQGITIHASTLSICHSNAESRSSCPNRILNHSPRSSCKPCWKDTQVDKISAYQTLLSIQPIFSLTDTFNPNKQLLQPRRTCCG